MKWQRGVKQDLKSKYGVSGRYQLPDSFTMVFQYISDNYQYIGTIEGTDYSVYLVCDK
jgi:hypothetical protein